MKRVLIGCECSGRVREAFRARGHDAWSCDLQPAEDSSPYHHQCDVFEAINERGPWDTFIGHPPCDFLTVSGNKWFKPDAKARPGVLTGASRVKAQQEAVAFVMRMWDCGIQQVAIENPIGRLSTLWQEPTQTIQPFEFGEPYRKATCLWLKNLPPLQPTHVPDGDLFLPPEPTDIKPAVWLEPPGPDRKRNRSRTYAGIAEAMAEQWGSAAVPALTP